MLRLYQVSDATDISDHVVKCEYADANAQGAASARGQSPVGRIILWRLDLIIP